MVRAADVVCSQASVDFVDINAGCPIDFVYERGAGLLKRVNAIELMIRGLSAALPCPVTLKTRTAIKIGQNTAHLFLPRCAEWGASALTLHGRSREQRYTKLADWEYIDSVAEAV